MKGLLAALVISILSVCFSYANDSVIEMGAGGISYVRTDAIEMLREDLYISADEVRVDYQFRNFRDEDIETLVAFPMPDIGGSYVAYESDSAPHPESSNFMDFSVTVDGQPLVVNHEERAISFGIDVTDELASLGIPVYPMGQDTRGALEGLSPEVGTDLAARGIVSYELFDNGDGLKTYVSATWVYRSTYWWRMVFPAGKTIRVSHRYTPAVGGTVGVSFLDPEGKPGYNWDKYITKYCVDEGFTNAVKRRLAATGPDRSPFWESWISYVLTTGQNWLGTIKEFHLTVDKGSTDNLVSFCADGLKKTGPTTFEVTYTDFYPERDLDILLLQAVE